MAISFNKIEKEFRELRDFILNDLNLILAQRTGGNYSAMLLITAACEALGHLRYGTKSGGQRFFAEYLLPTNWQTVGKSLYNGLRNGLAHAYRTKTIIVVGKRRLEIGISWKERPHLTYNTDQSCLYLNVKTLANSLHAAFHRYEKELKDDSRLRMTFQTWMNKESEVRVQDSKEQVVWNKLLQVAPSKAT